MLAQKQRVMTADKNKLQEELGLLQAIASDIKGNSGAMIENANNELRKM